MTTGKTTALTRHTFVSKVISLLFNTLSRFVIAILPRSKCLLILWLHSLSALILGPKKMKSDCFHISPIYLPWSGGTRCHDFLFESWVLSQLFHSPFSLSARGSLVLFRFNTVKKTENISSIQGSWSLNFYNYMLFLLSWEKSDLFVTHHILQSEGTLSMLVIYSCVKKSQNLMTSNNSCFLSQNYLSWFNSIR